MLGFFMNEEDSPWLRTVHRFEVARSIRRIISPPKPEEGRERLQEQSDNAFTVPSFTNNY